METIATAPITPPEWFDPAIFKDAHQGILDYNRLLETKVALKSSGWVESRGMQFASGFDHSKFNEASVDEQARLLHTDLRALKYVEARASHYLKNDHELKHSFDHAVMLIETSVESYYGASYDKTLEAVHANFIRPAGGSILLEKDHPQAASCVKNADQLYRLIHDQSPITDKLNVFEEFDTACAVCSISDHFAGESNPEGRQMLGTCWAAIQKLQVDTRMPDSNLARTLQEEPTAYRQVYIEGKFPPLELDTLSPNISVD